MNIGDDAILRLWHAAQKDPHADVPTGHCEDDDNWEGTEVGDLFEALQDFALYPYPQSQSGRVDDFLADLERQVTA